MESIILISFSKIINESEYKTFKNKDIIDSLNRQIFLIRPSSFEEFKKFISTYNEKKNTTRKIVGLYPSGERIEIKDEESYKKEISIFLVLNVQIKKKLFSDINTKGFFKSEINFLENVKNSLNLLKKKTIDFQEKINTLKKRLSKEIEQAQNTILGKSVIKDNDILDKSNENYFFNGKGKNIF